MAPARKNDSVVNIDAWAEDEDRALVGRGEAERDVMTNVLRDLEHPRPAQSAAPDRRELSRHEFPES
jgi:hypothetical protein